MEAHQQTPQMAMLAEVSSALRMESEAGSGTPYEIVDKALDRCATLSPVAAAAAFLVGRDGQLKLRGCRGWTPVSGIGTFFGGLDLLVRAIEHPERPLMIPSDGLHAKRAADVLNLSGFPSLLVIPLLTAHFVMLSRNLESWSWPAPSEPGPRSGSRLRWRWAAR